MSTKSPQLTTFLKVAELGNVSRAAERLHLSQPAVTKQLRALEQALGVELVERTGRGVRLTEAGELLRDYGARSSALLDECSAELEALRVGSIGKLAIGAGVTTSVFQLPSWLRRFSRKRPGIEVTVKTGTSSTVEAWVTAREIDLGFVTSRITSPELETCPLYEEEIVLVLAPHRDSRRRVDVSKTSLILFPAQTGFRAYLDAALASAGLKPLVKMETDSIEAIKSFVGVGLGASFLPITAVAAELDSGRLVRASAKGVGPLRRQTSVVWRSDRKLSLATREFLEIVRRASGRRRRS